MLDLEGLGIWGIELLLSVVSGGNIKTIKWYSAAKMNAILLISLKLLSGRLYMAANAIERNWLSLLSDRL